MEAEAADGDQRHDGQQHHRIVLNGNKPALQIEARIAKGGNRVENRVPNALEQAMPWHHAGHQQQSAQPLRGQGHQHDPQRQAHHPLQSVLAEGALQGQPVAQADALAQGHHQQRGKGHEPKAAKLDQQHQQQLAEKGQVRAGVQHRKAGDADGGGCGEQGVHEGQRLARGHHRQAKQQRACEDKEQESHEQDARGRKQASKQLDAVEALQAFSSHRAKGLGLRQAPFLLS